MIDFSNNPFYKIVDKKSNDIIACGKVINQKNFYTDKAIALKNALITFDNRHFFRSNGNDRYDVIECDSIDFKLDIPDDYKVVQWLSFDELDESIDVAREYDINELDEEVKEIVAVLNNMDRVETLGSCSGHNKNKLYVDIRFSSLSALQIIVKYVENHSDELVLTTALNVKNYSNDGVIFKLLTKEVGYKAYKSINKMAQYIRMINSIKY